MALSAPAAPAEDLERSYRIEADLGRNNQHTISAHIDISLRNRGALPLDRIEIAMFPNRYQKELPHLNDLNYRRIYAGQWKRGGLKIRSVEIDGKSLSWRKLDEEGVFGEILLPTALKVGESIAFRIGFDVAIPEKFGPFGTYRGETTLSGAWYPYVVAHRGQFMRTDDAPIASWDVRVMSNEEIVINGTKTSRESGYASYRADRAREVSLVSAPSFESDEVRGRRRAVRFFWPSHQRAEVKTVMEVAVRWLDYVERQPMLDTLAGSRTLVQAPLRNIFTAEGEGVTLLSDRAFKIIDAIGQYHSIALIRALFLQEFSSAAAARESSEDARWVAEALACYWTDRLVRDFAFENVDARTLGPIRALSFLPSIDQMIYAPQFAFVDMFHDLVYPNDPVRDDPHFFQHRRPHGRTIYAHLEDEIGIAQAANIAAKYFQAPGESFRNLAIRESGGDLSLRFEQWVRPRARVNYSLGRHRVSNSEGGELVHEIEIRKENGEELIEPVELLVRTSDGAKQTLFWNGEGKSHRFQFQNRARVTLLEIDPRHRLLETDLSDNRDPPRYKLVLNDFIINYDFNENRPEGYVITQFRRAYGGKNRYSLSGSTFQDTYGGSVGISRLFGRLIDRIRLSHAMGVSFSFFHRDRDLVLAEDPAGVQDLVVEASPQLNTTSVTLSYFTGNQLSLTNPLKGGGTAASITLGSDLLGGDSNYYLAALSASWILPFHPHHFVAVRGEFGVSGPEEIPSQVQFHLGGLGGIRGISASDDRFSGRYTFLASAEYRHLFIPDIDWNLWLFRVRDIQGALFSDAGRVTDTVQEKAERAAFGTQTKSSFTDLFDVADFSTDVGYGIRFLIEWLGVNPGLLRFDVAKSLSEEEEGVRVYFGVTQSF